MSKKTIIKMCSWGLAILVSVLAITVWAGERVDGGTLSLYDWFPLLGLLAFSLMWTHYIVGSLRRNLRFNKTDIKSYMKITSAMVLAFILLHPGLLILQLNRDGFGLPPASYQSVYPDGLQLAIMLGMVSLLIFLAFELKRWLGKKTWWRVVEYAQVVAMFVIFYHGLRLGRELNVGWYEAVWYFYGVSLFISVAYNHWYDRSTKQEQEGV